MASKPTTEWHTWCRGRDLQVADDTVTVSLPDGRRHRVVVSESGDALLLVAKVATRSALQALRDPELEIWGRNRALQLVGFRIDRHDRLIAESHVPRAGLTADEFLFYVRTLAVEADRYEALLTGADEE